MAASEGDLTHGPLWRRFRDVAAPAAVGMLFSTLYNVVDVYFAGMISTEAQAGLAVAFPPFMMLMTVGIGLGVAMSALVGGALGAKERARARALSLQGAVFGSALSAALIVLGLVLAPLVLQLTSEPGVYRDLGARYVSVLMLALPGFVLAFTVNGVLQAQGDAVSMQRALIVACLANVGLNPLLIWGAPGVWSGMGFDGIAVATILSQSGVAAYLIHRALRTELSGRPRWAELPPRADIVGEILRQQAPATSAMLVLFVASIVIQAYVKRFGPEAVAAAGVALRVEQLFLLPAFGLTQALLPIAAQAYGAGLHDRARAAFATCVGIGMIYMAVACPILWLAAPQLMAVFDDDPAVIAIGVGYLRVDGVILPAYLTLFAVNAWLQALKKPNWAFVIGVYRQALAVPLFIWLWVDVGGWGVFGVWMGIATAVLTGVAVALPLAHWVARPVVGGLWSGAAARPAQA